MARVEWMSKTRIEVLKKMVGDEPNGAMARFMLAENGHWALVKEL